MSSLEQVQTPPQVTSTINPSFTETAYNSSSTDCTGSDNTGGFSNKTIIIILCGIILIILLHEHADNTIRKIVGMVYNLVVRIFALFGLVIGSAINVGADAAGDVARTGVDIAEGSLHSVGNILTGSQKVQLPQLQTQPLKLDNKQPDLDNTVNTSTVGKQTHQEPQPDTTENPIQNPITQNKTSWCLVGEYKGRRGCIDVSDESKCISGQVYPSQKMCLNPTLAQNP